MYLHKKALKRNKQTVINFFLLAGLVAIPLLFSFFATPLFGEETADRNADAIKTYQEHRLSFVGKQNKVKESFQSRQGSLSVEITELQEKINGQNEALAELNQSISVSEVKLTIMEGIRNILAMILFPLAMVFSLPLYEDFFNGFTPSSLLLMIFLPITCLNIGIFLLFRNRAMITKLKIILIIALVIFISSISAPLFADELSRREEVIQQLGFAEQVLSLSDHERFLAILESGVVDKVDLPELEAGDPLLKVYRQVYLNTPQYYFTLAALYTYEQKTGKAVSAIGKLTSEKQIGSFADSDIIIVNSIKFLIQQKHTQLASAAIENLGDNIINVSSLLDLAVYLQDHGMQVSADKILSDVIDRAKTTADLVSLATFFIKQQENDKGTEALFKALAKVENIDDIISVAEAAITLNKDQVIAKLVDNVQAVSRDYSSTMKVVDMFLEHGRQEDAILVFSGMISAVKKRSQDYSNRLLFLTEAALERSLFEQAVNAISKLSMYLGARKYEMLVSIKGDLQSVQGIPDADKITLPLFYGLLNEELNFNSRAEDVYMQTVLASLAKILKSYGYDLPNSLNDYHLLGRIWVKENKGDLLSKLDKVYNILEEQFLKRQEGRYEEELSTQQQELKALEAQYEETREMVSAKSKVAAAKLRKVMIHIISTVAIILFLIGVTVGCVIFSWRYSQKLDQHKTFGFVTRFVEVTGWVRIFSMLAAVSGLASILVAQLFQIIQKTHENSHASLARTTPLPVAEEQTTEKPIIQKNAILDSEKCNHKPKEVSNQLPKSTEPGENKCREKK